MTRYKLILEYDGTSYSGWQKQENAPTIQQTIEEAFKQFLGRSVEVVGSGRTDAGVHALGQVAHVDVEGEKWNCDTLMSATNHFLKNTGIAVVSIETTSDQFHARFDARERHYYYHILNRRAPLTWQRTQAWQVYQGLDCDAMTEAAVCLIGHHDFSSFRDSQCQSLSPVKTLNKITITRQKESLLVHVSARSFLHHQVRIMVGTLVEIGRGKWRSSYIQDILDAKDRRAAGPTAPAQGLYFERIDY
jgi:tRNA pseudouridine38-40 synthase